MTMTVERDVEDGDLIGAKRRLGDAVSKLIDPQQEYQEGHLYWSDSIYDQLLDACPGDQGKSHSLHAGSIVPFWVDAVDLKHEIDTAVGCWEPCDTYWMFGPPYPVTQIDLTKSFTPLTVLRLQMIDRRKWRPSDCRGIDQITQALEQWTASIKALLTPVPRWSLPNPCPNCNVAIVYRKDAAGENVRQSALQLTPDGGAKCQSCQVIWAPYAIQILAGALGYPLPKGVIS